MDIVDLAPQFRSVHYKLPSLEDEITEPQESNMSLIASLRSADVIVYRHDNTSLTLPDIPASQRDDLVHISLQQLDVKVRQGFKILGSVAVGDIEATINTQEINTLVGSVKEWMIPVDDLTSTMDTVTKIRVCKSRNLVAAIVLAGEERGVSNDPPFLTRPSHVLRISKNLRINDSWKISARTPYWSFSPTGNQRNDSRGICSVVGLQSQFDGSGSADPGEMEKLGVVQYSGDVLLQVVVWSCG